MIQENMNSRQSLGRKGEMLAQKYLEENGYEIIETNFMCRQGEIDIIAIRNRELTFIEVKTRGQDFFGKPAEAVTSKKKRHIYNVAEFYLYIRKMKDINIHFDVIEVYIYETQAPKIMHIKDAITEK